MKRNLKQMLPVALMIGVTIIISFFLYYKVMKLEEQKCWQLLEDSAQSVTKEIRTSFQNDIQTLTLAKEIAQWNSSNKSKISTVPLQLFGENTIFSRIDVIYPDNTVVLEDGSKKKLPDNTSFEQIAAKGEHMSARMTDIESEAESVYYCIPISENGKITAILSGVVDSGELAEKFHPSIYGGKAVSCIIDSADGNFIMDEWHDKLENAYEMPDRVKLKEYEQVDLKSETRNQKTGVIAFESKTNGKVIYMYYAPIQLFGWELEVFTQEDVIFANVLYLRKLLIFAGFVEILLMILYFLWNYYTVEKLRKSRAETVKQLNISNTLIRCVTELSTDQNINVSINNLLHIITEYFQADRAYIFELDPEKNTFLNTYEYAREGVKAQIDTMPEIPASMLSKGLEAFQSSQVYYVPDVEQEKESDSYKILNGRNIFRLLAVPLRKNEEIVGFMSVDNPRAFYEDATLLSSIQFFITNSLSMKKTQEELNYMSYRDSLTSLYNRNKYMQILNSYKNQMIDHVGALYLDLNGLKGINDQKGHVAGDLFIKQAAKTIQEIYPQNTYRIGGDEFVVLSFPVKREEFETQLYFLQKQLKAREICVSIGSIWKDSCDNLEGLLKEADRRMYEEKKQYYERKNAMGKNG